FADRVASVTTPDTREPAGSTATPPTVTARARCAATGSSTRLVAELTVVSRTIGRVVPAGMVTSRQTGAAVAAPGRLAPELPAVATGAPLVSEAAVEDGVANAFPRAGGPPLHAPAATLAATTPIVIKCMRIFMMIV